MNSIKKRDLFTIGALLTVVICFFWKAVFLKGFFFHGEISLQFIPFIKYGVASIKSGVLPLWISAMDIGYPYIASTQTNPCFYPLNFLFYMLPAHIACNYTIVLHFFLLLLFTYLYVKSIKLSNIAALSASIIFTFGGFIVTRVNLLFIIEAAIWLPLILLFIELGFTRNKKMFFVWAGIAFGVQFMAGAQLWFYTLITVFFYIMYKFILFLKKDKNRSFKNNALNHMLIPFLFVFFVGLSVCAIQFLPQYELSKYVGRASGDMTFKVAGELQLCPEEIISFAFPKYFGTRLNQSYVGRSFPVSEYSYFGIYGLLLILIGVCYQKKKREYPFYLFMAITALLLAFGKYSFLYFLQYQLPGFNCLRYPMRYLYLFNFAMAIFAGYGIDYISDGDTDIIYKINKKLMAGIISLGLFIYAGGILFGDTLIIFGKKILENLIHVNDPAILESRYYTRLTGIINQAKDVTIFIQPIAFAVMAIIVFYLWKKKTLATRSLRYFLVAGIAADLFLQFGNYNPLISKDYYMSRPEILKFLQKDKEPNRIIVLADKYFKAIPYEGWTFKDLKSHHLSKEALPWNWGVPYGINNISRGTSVPVRRYTQFLYDILNINDENFMTKLNLLSLINVKYIISAEEFYHPALKLVYKSEMNVYENKNVLHRAFLVNNFIAAKNEKEVMRLLKTKDFPFDKSVIIEHCPDIILKSFGTDSINKKSNIKIIKYSAQKVVIEATVLENSFLVLGDQHYPGWEAYVNGKKTDIYPANYVMRAIYLKKENNRQTIEFIYKPKLFILGAYISICAVLAITMLFIGKILFIFKPEKL